MIKFSLAAQKLAHISPAADFDSSVKYGPGQREEKGREGSSRGKYSTLTDGTTAVILVTCILLLPSDISSPSLFYKVRESISCSLEYRPGP